MSQLVAAGLRLRAGSITPQDVAAAIEVASAQGWRRPLLAWLAVQAGAQRKAETRHRSRAFAGGSSSSPPGNSGQTNLLYLSI
jgi:hypothetical protein